MTTRPTGSPVMDEMLDGGYEKGVLTCVYGPAGSGKSNLMLLELATVENKAIFVDTEGSFSVARLEQLAPDAGDLLDRILVLKATSLDEQTRIISMIPSMVKKGGIDVVIVDGIATQYRAALARGDKEANNELSKQINVLYSMAMEYDIAVLMTSQVYADMESDGVKVVGGDIVKYSAKCMIELRNDDKREMVLVRHRHLPIRKKNFIIENVGVYEA